MKSKVLRILRILFLLSLVGIFTSCREITTIAPQNNGQSFSGSQYVDQLAKGLWPAIRESLKEVMNREGAVLCEPIGRTSLNNYLKALDGDARTECGTFLKEWADDLYFLLDSNPTIDTWFEDIEVLFKGELTKVVAAANPEEIRVHFDSVMRITEIRFGAFLAHEIFHMLKKSDGKQRFGDDDAVAGFNYLGGLHDLLVGAGNYIMANAIEKKYYTWNSGNLPSHQDIEHVTTCAHTFAQNGTGWRSHDWQATDCSNGLPTSDHVSIASGYNGAGKTGQVFCSEEKGMHYNHPQFVGPTNGTVRCLFIKPGVESPVTKCSFKWPGVATGWRTKVWTDADCTHGLPTMDHVAVAQAGNGVGVGATPVCNVGSGSVYNHPTLHGAGSASISCLFLRRPDTDVQVNYSATHCRYQDTAFYTGWRGVNWTEDHCSDGLPQPGSDFIGNKTNGNGTAGAFSCSINSGNAYNHPQYGATSSDMQCLFIKKD